ncbi:MAG: hypothetical protein QXO40_02315 [Candidatus Aenigmatarchaeota archaeon]
MQFSKSYKNCTLLIVFVFFILIITLVVKTPKLKINLSCDKMLDNELSCKFNCTINVERCDKLMGRVVITHSGWAAIYDNTFNLTCSSSFKVVLPRRNYNYVIRVGVYDDNENFGTVEKTIMC